VSVAGELSARFGTAFDVGVVAMALVAPDGRYVRVNDAFCAFVGRPAGELTGLAVDDVAHPEDRAAYAAATARLLAGEATIVHGETRYVRPGGAVVSGAYAGCRVDGKGGAPIGVFLQVVNTTELLGARDELRRRDEVLRVLADTSDEVMLFRTRTVPELRIEQITQGAAAIIGRTPAELYADPTLLFRSVHPDDRAALVAATEDRDAPPESLPLRFVHPDGTVVWTEGRATPIRDETGMVVGVEGVAYVTAARAVHQAVQAENARFRSLVQNATDIVMLVSEDGIVEYVSPAVVAHVGVQPEEVLGKVARDFAFEEDRPALQVAFQRATPGRSVRADFRVRHVDGSTRWMDGSVLNLLDDPNVGAFVLNSRDVTEQRALTERLRMRAYRDELTGLPNRLGLRDRIAAEIDGPGADGTPFVVLLVAAHGLASIVEVFGHQRFDRLVVEVAGRLRATLPEGATLARMGADDFGVLLAGASRVAAVSDVVTAVLAAFEQPVPLDGESFQLDGAIGVATFPAHGEDPDALLRRAELARRAADERHSGFAVYAPRLDDTPARHVALLGRLRAAMDEGQLELHYQPKVALGTRAVYGVEALLRWQHPELGFVPPDRFIPLAERSGLIKPLTLWVVDAAVREVAAWRRDGVDLTVAVNVTPRNLQDPGFPHDVAAILAEWDVPAASLWLELTERAIMTDPETAVAACGRLVGMGVSLSLDDFGTGQSSFAYVASLPVAEIKIDGRFVADLAGDGPNVGITRAVVGLGHHLGHTVIAEGVEDAATLARLDELGCDAAQGYYLSRPLPALALREWLVTSPWSSATPG
jgi:PAS domain S-box-containing protein/diguanylate cyclase (GGDEF)-like protein